MLNVTEAASALQGSRESPDFIFLRRCCSNTLERMKAILLIRQCANLVFCLAFSLSGMGQSVTPASPATPVPTAGALPFPTQARKAVVFIQTDCLVEPTPQELLQMPPGERAKWTPEAVSRLNSGELANLKHTSYSGTGFIVSVPEPRLGANQSFTYLVTNRHVAQPGIEDGKPCKVVNHSLFLNRKKTVLPGNGQMQAAQTGSVIDWLFPTDDAVDLAVTPLNTPQTEWDVVTIELGMFATQQMVSQHQIVEGDPVIFAGLFIQYFGISKLEPVVRSGTIAMLPDDLIPTTLKKPGHIYFAEAHAFGGNSGSPMFVDINKFAGIGGFNYKFLGVVSGEVHESSDFTIETVASYKGNVPENSDISSITPAHEVFKLLTSARLVAMRDLYVAQHALPK